MKTVNCEDCLNFVPDAFEDEDDEAKVTEKAFCLLGKRIMFRNATENNWMYPEEYGYRRRCEEFNRKL